MLRELEQTFPGLKTMFTDPEQDDEDDEEVFKDVPENDEDKEEPAVEMNNLIHPDRAIKPDTKRKDMYDGRKRDPEHSQADKSCLWEVLPFVSHFHPSVQLFADRLLDGSDMPPKPDLASHTLIAFLDRFVYKNAKAASSGLRGSSIMQPLAGGESQGVLVSNRVARQDTSVNTEAFWRKKAEDVAVDQVFFHKYFSQIGKNKPSTKKAKKDAKAADAMDSEAEDENEDEIWDALVSSRPDVEGPSDDDEDDFDMADMEDSDEEDDGVMVDADVDVEGTGDEAEDGASVAEDDIDSEDDGVMFDEDEDDLIDEAELFERELETAQAQVEEEEKPEKKETSRSRKKKMKALPTFASIDDYAAMLEQDDGEDI